jgi:hypothetical protein
MNIRLFLPEPSPSGWDDMGLAFDILPSRQAPDPIVELGVSECRIVDFLVAIVTQDRLLDLTADDVGDRAFTDSRVIFSAALARHLSTSFSWRETVSDIGRRDQQLDDWPYRAEAPASVDAQHPAKASRKISGFLLWRCWRANLCPQ